MSSHLENKNTEISLAIFWAYTGELSTHRLSCWIFRVDTWRLIRPLLFYQSSMAMSREIEEGKISAGSPTTFTTPQHTADRGHRCHDTRKRKGLNILDCFKNLKSCLPLERKTSIHTVKKNFNVTNSISAYNWTMQRSHNYFRLKKYIIQTQ